MLATRLASQKAKEVEKSRADVWGKELGQLAFFA